MTQKPRQFIVYNNLEAVQTSYALMLYQRTLKMLPELLLELANAILYGIHRIPNEPQCL
jgi:hypothetical protein